MKKFNTKTILVYIILVIYLLFSSLYGYKNFSNIMSEVINPTFYIVLFIVTLLISNSENTQRIKARKNKYQTIFIVTISYLIFYILLGLILGYVKTIYSHNLIGISKNIWMYITPIIFIEIIRNNLIRNSGNKKFVYILIVIIFTLIDIDLYNIFSSSLTYSELVKLIFEIIVPSLTANIVLTYISKTSGYITNLIYIIPQKLTLYILPIIPDLNWYFRGLLGVLLPTIAFFLIKNLDTKLENIEPRFRPRKSRQTKMIPIIILIAVFALFVAGFFKYKPTVIVSNSMHPIFNRGDIVIVEKINTENCEVLKKYDIIEYKLNNTIIAHRIIYIEKHNDGSTLYITKGDNNNTSDKEKVKPNQIIGVVKFRIPKVGYPTVWLNDFLSKNQKIGVEAKQ